MRQLCRWRCKLTISRLLVHRWVVILPRIDVLSREGHSQLIAAQTKGIWIDGDGKVGIVSKSAQKLVGRLTLFQGISQVLSHRKTT